MHKITDIINKIEYEITGNRPGNEKMQQLYFRQLLILISRYRKQPTVDTASPVLLQISDVVEYINKNYNTDISLDTLSRILSLSPSHLSKSFKSVTGVGIKEYIKISRIEAAKSLLVTTELSITEIAIKCGFNDSNYFAAVFKKLVGITPKRYSLLHKKDE